MRFKAKAGERFVVVPATMNPLEKDKKFWLRVYFDCEIYKVDLRRVDLHENYKFLMTEYEKTERIVPAWKIQQV